MAKLETEIEYTMKRKFSIIVLVLVVFCSAEADNIFIDGIYYQLNEKFKTAEVTFKGKDPYKHDEYKGDIVIPAKVLYNNELYQVITLSPYAFANCKSLKSVHIVAPIRMISKACFLNCTNLQSVHLPNSIEVIRMMAFSNCLHLADIQIPSSVTTICDKAFSGCVNMHSICTSAEHISPCAFDTSTVIIRSVNSAKLNNPHSVVVQIVESDIKKKVQKEVDEISANGWKTYAESPSFYEQLYEAYIYKTNSQNVNPLKILYKTIGKDIHMCVTQMLKEAVKRDVLDWLPEYTEYMQNLHNGKKEIELATLLYYPDFLCEIEATYKEKSWAYQMQIKNEDDRLTARYSEIIHPFVRLFRDTPEGKEEMLIATFTDEFINGFRVPLPVYDGYWSGNVMDDEVVVNYNLHYQIREIVREIGSFSFGVSNESTYIGYYVLDEKRLKMIVTAEYIQKEVE